MEKSQRFSFQRRLESFKYAWNGLRILIKEEHNSRIHLIVAIIVFGLGFYFEISLIEWMLVLLSVALVFALELVNSAIENLSDLVSQERHPLIEKIKDLAAAAVLVGAISSIFIGGIVFIPKFMILFKVFCR